MCILKKKVNEPSQLCVCEHILFFRKIIFFVSYRLQYHEYRYDFFLNNLHFSKILYHILLMYTFNNFLLQWYTNVQYITRMII